MNCEVEQAATLARELLESLAVGAEGHAVNLDLIPQPRPSTARRRSRTRRLMMQPFLRSRTQTCRHSSGFGGIKPLGSRLCNELNPSTRELVR